MYEENCKQTYFVVQTSKRLRTQILIYLEVMKLLLLLIFFTVLEATITQSNPAGDIQMLTTFHPHLGAFQTASFQQLTNINWRPPAFLYQGNQRNSKLIYNWMLEALTSPNSTHRRFFMTEISFLRDWYEWVGDEKRHGLKELIKTGQLQYPNAGWVENDEAVCYYDDIIEQYTLGMDYMYEKFGLISRVAWATASYGHSHSQVALLNELGFEMQGIERVDERFIFRHNDKPLLEFYWKAKSDSNNITYGGLMTHIRHFTHELESFRKGPQVELIENMVPAMKKLYEKNIFFRYFGNDFEQFQTSEFENLEKTMKDINEKTQCQSVHYGNPSQYLIRLKEYYGGNTLRTREEDLMPNWEKGQYWTGFYTTFPQLKKACRDYSRLLNFLKKDTLRFYSVFPGANIKEAYQRIIDLERLNALMQHHDGITGTSKHFIVVEMMKKILKAEKEINNIIQQTNSLQDMVNCQIHKNNYECILGADVADKFTLVLLNVGTERLQRIQVVLPEGKHYKLHKGKAESINNLCYNMSRTQCRIVLQFVVKPGINHLEFSKEEQSKFKNSAMAAFTCPYKELTFGQSFKLRILDDNVISYTFGDNIVNISYVASPAQAHLKPFQKWNKWGKKETSKVNIKSGLVVMANNGELINHGGKATLFNIIKTGKYARAIIKFEDNLKVTITIHEDKRQILDIITDFKPSNDSQKKDYFIKIQSNVQGNNDLYHDANGYLVMRRIYNSRSDYQFNVAQQDKINSNTYPSTSFAYLKNKKSKLVVGVDRGEGITLYSNDTLLVNIDRITQDDGKGAGDSYTKTDLITFRHRIALVGAKKDIERLWQKQYDQPILGYYGTPGTAATDNPSNPKNDDNKYLKMTIAFLDGNRVILRFQNLAEFKSIKIKLFENKKIVLNDFGLDLDFIDIAQSFHNGIPLYPTHQWLKLEEKNIVNIHENQLDKNGWIELKPLQIRSFRIDFQNKINKNAPQAPKVAEPLPIKHLSQHGVYTNKRCF